MDLFSAYATDTTKEIDGVWFPVPGGNAQLLIARSTNPRYTSALLKAFQEFKGITEPNEEQQKRQDEVFIALLAKHILRGWRNVTRKGEEFPYDYDNAVTLLRLPDFRKYVQECSDKFDAYRLEAEEAVGNS